MKRNIIYSLKKLKREKKSMKLIFYIILYIIKIRWDMTKKYLNPPKPITSLKKFSTLTHLKPIYIYLKLIPLRVKWDG